MAAGSQAASWNVAPHLPTGRTTRCTRTNLDTTGQSAQWSDLDLGRARRKIGSS